MIIIHEGVPGSGKSYDAIRKILDILKTGRAVWTNIDGLEKEDCREYIANWCGITRDALEGLLVPMSKDTVMSFWDHVPPGAFIVIDEAQLFFNSRDFAKSANRDFGDWASTHRHHGYDLILITQKAERIDSAVRALSEFRYRYRKLNVFGSLVKNGYIVFTHFGDDPKHANFVKRSYDKKIFPAYNSYQGDVTEKRFKNPNLLNHPIFWALGACVVAVVFLAPKGLLMGSMLKGKVAITEEAHAIDIHDPGVGLGGRASAPTQPYTSYEYSSPELPITGWMHLDGRLLVIMPDGKRRWDAKALNIYNRTASF